MQEHYPPGAIPPASYSSLSHSLHTSSSSGPPSLSHRTTASSIMSDDSSRLPPQYSNGPRPTSDREKTPVSSHEYSNASYLDGNYTTGDDIYRPPGALPPDVPSTHSSTSYSTQPFNSYAYEQLQDINGYQHQEPRHSQSHQYSSQSPKPPPLPPKPTAFNDYHPDLSGKYADARQASPPIDTSLCTSSSIQAWIWY